MDPLAEMRLRLDPSLLMYDIGLPPDPWQASAMRSKADRVGMLCARGCGRAQRVHRLLSGLRSSTRAH